LFTRGFNGGAGALAECMDGRGVAKVGREVGKHGVEDSRIDGRSGVVIEVDAVHTTTNRILLAGNHEEWPYSHVCCFLQMRMLKGPERPTGG